MAAFITLRQASLRTIFFRVRLREPSLRHQRALWRESHGRSLYEHDVRPSHDFRPRDAWLPPRGGVRHALDVLMLSCGTPQLSLT
jgi:hypothetical protein